MINKKGQHVNMHAMTYHSVRTFKDRLAINIDIQTFLTIPDLLVRTFPLLFWRMMKILRFTYIPVQKKNPKCKPQSPGCAASMSLGTPRSPRTSTMDGV